MAFLDETGLNYFKRKNDETYAFKAHTHNYAGSSSAGGSATSANKLNTNAGGATTPVYFSNGVPVACTSYSSASVNYATTAGKLGTSTVGGTTTPIYLNNGVPTALGYTIAKSVPSNAVFTDTDTKNTAGATNTTSKIYLTGATTQASSAQTYSNANVYAQNGVIFSHGIGKSNFIVYPDGGMLDSPSETITGYCKIILPTLFDSTMMSFTVTIYNYLTDESVDYKISGYNYAGDGGSWYNPTAICIGKASSSHSNLTVRFGHDGTKAVIAIGEADTKWNFPRIAVHDIVVGNGNKFDVYKSGWRVIISADALKRVDLVKANTHVGYGSATSWGNVSGKPSFSKVATSGSYNDLSNKPTIPSVGNGTVTITQNGVSKGSFTLNQSGNATIALTDTDTNTTYSAISSADINALFA